MSKSKKLRLPDQRLNVAIIQLNSNDQMQRNLGHIWGLLDKILKHSKKQDRKNKIHLITLPENALFLRVSTEDQLNPLAIKDRQLMELNEWAIENQFVIHIGAVAIRQRQKVYNATVLLGREKNPELVYKKIHLFDVNIGKKPLRESDDFASGSRASIIEVKGWRMGLSICYDLRFPELFVDYAKKGVDILLVPAAFLKITGQAHWHTLLRARAIESQAFVLAAAQCGVHSSDSHKKTRETFGHSLAIDPWGRILSENKKAMPSVEYVQLDPKELKKVRLSIPIKDHRKLK